MSDARYWEGLSAENERLYAELQAKRQEVDLLRQNLEAVTYRETFQRAANQQLLKDFDDLKDTLMDVCCQSFGEYSRARDAYGFDHMCLSAYEGAVDKMLELKMITKEQVMR